jgi:hypothetical protein
VATASAEGDCERRDTVRADVDGDGAADRVFHAWIRDRAVLGVCTAAGDTDRMRGVGQAELLQIVDVEGDAADEIFYGGTTAAAQLFSVAVFSQGDLRRVLTPGSDPFVLVDGADPGTLTTTTPAGGAVGCPDLDDDGAAVIVQVTVTARGRRNLQWSLAGYEIQGGIAATVTEANGSRRNDPAKPDPREVVQVAQTLTDACGK